MNNGLYGYDGSNPTLVRCTFTGNSAEHGGGMFNHYDSFTLINCTFSGNRAEGEGGGIAGWISNSTLINCTLSGNRAGTEGGGIFYWDDDGHNPKLTNCIVWANNAEQGPQISAWGTTLSASYCNIEGGRMDIYLNDGATLDWREGNIGADPCFAGPGYWDPNGTAGDPNDDFWVDGDYHLKSEGWRWDVSRGVWTWDDVTSLCVDAGNPGSALGDELLSVPDDPGNEWGENVRINMGAYGGTGQASMGPVGWALLADMNNDRVVDFSDVGIWAGYWLEAGDELPGDLNRDGVVDGIDYALVGLDFGK